MKTIMRHISFLLAMMLLCTLVPISVSAEDIWDGTTTFTDSSEPLAHNWTDATCIAPKTCLDCGSTEGEANPYAHSFVNGTCEHCGETASLCGDTLYWVLGEDGVLTISGTGKMYDFTASETSTVKEQAPWFSDRMNITKIVIENGATSIGEYAFFECGAAQASVAQSVVSIGEYAFAGCTGLAEITLEEGLQKIDHYALKNCDSLTEVTVPSTITDMGMGVFSGCDQLESVTLLGSDTVLEQNLFAFCTALKNITIPDCITHIYTAAFEGCTSLTEITIPAGVVSMYNDTFKNCTNLASITFEGSAPALYSNHFLNVTATAYYPGNDSTWTSAICQNYGGTINWVPHCKNGHNWSDANCTNPKTCSVCTATEGGADPNGHSFENGLCKYCSLPGGTCGTSLYWVFQDGTLTIYGTGIMDDCQYNKRPWSDYESQITTIHMEDGITRIGNYAFRDCSKVTTVTIADTVTEIGEQAFAFCYALTGIAIPDSVTLIEKSAFYQCSSLSQVTLPAALITIGDSLFSYCSSLTQIELPATVTSIPAYTFNRCSSLTSITIGSAVTKIASYAFYDCTALERITFTGAAPSIVSNAFGNVVANVYYPSEDPSWEGTAGRDFGGILTWVPPVENALAEGICGDDLTWRYNTAENNLLILGTGAMYDFTPDTVPWAAYKDDIINVKLAAEVTHLGDCAFIGMRNLKYINISKDLSSLGDRVFEGCTAVEFTLDSGNSYFSISNNALYRSGGYILYAAPSVAGHFELNVHASTIADYAFAGNTSITGFTAPNGNGTTYYGVRQIGSQAFSGCTALKSLTFQGNAPTIAADAFLGVTATVEYLSTKSGWDAHIDQNYGGTITWNQIQVAASGSNGSCSWILTEDGVMTFLTDYTSGQTIPSGGAHNTGAWYAYRDQIKHVVIPRAFYAIADNAFNGCTNLESVSMPGVYNIGQWAFSSCTSLKSIYLFSSGNAMTVGDYAFSGCTALEEASLYIRTDLGAYAFANCPKLKTIYINSAQYSMSYNFTAESTSFSGVTADVLCPYEVDTISSQFGGTLTYKNVDYGTCGENVRWAYDASTGMLTLTGTGAISSYYSGSYTPWTFRNSSITGITVSEGITVLPSYAFEYCAAATQVSLPSTLQSICPSAFYDCTLLNNLLIPRSVTYFTTENFNRCPNLTDIYYLGTQEQWDAIPNADLLNVYSSGWNDVDFTLHCLQWQEATATCTEAGLQGHYAFEASSAYSYKYDENWLPISAPQQVPALGHSWVDANCTTPKTCSVCTATEGEALGHSWVDANCTTAKTCSVCTATEGEPLGHSWVDANCTTPKTCSVCTATEGEALGHSWVDANCTTPKTCSVCTATEGEALGHSWVGANCTTPKTCSVCTATEGEALGHSWVDANCTTPKTCSVCTATEGEALGHSWVDANCTTPKTCSVCTATEGEALGHSWVDANCTTPKTCSVCTATEGEALGHSWVDANCTTAKTCSVCTATEGEPLGHSWVDANCTTPKTCSVCTATEGEALGHSWVGANCTTPKTCSVCTATEGEALGHSWIDANCTTPKTCSVCTATEGEPLGHTTVSDDAVAATCTKDGLTEGSHCSVCGFVIKAQETIPATDHSPVADSAVEPTCTEPGKTAGIHCVTCGKVFTAQKTIPAKGHTEVADAGIAVTCTTDGLTAGKHCSVCEEVLIKQEIISAPGHTEVTDTAVAATCTEDGLTEGKHCSVCEEVLIKQEIISAPGHTEVTDAAVAATCTEDGLTEGIHCAVCGLIIQAQEVIPATDHSPVADSAVEPTCTEPGKTAGIHCVTCGKVFTAQEFIPAKGHTYDSDQDDTCNSCGAKREVELVIQTTPMYRLYNPNSGEHFYTGSVEEKDNLVVAGWQYEGIAWNAPTNTGDPVYRLFNPNSGDHHYTMSAEERDNLVAVGWIYEGIAWNSAPVDHHEALPLYRLYNPNADCGSHHYTGSTEERDFLVSVGWLFEGIGWFGMLR